MMRGLMKKISTLLFILMFFAACSLTAQSGNGIIVGVVKDLKTGYAIKNVRVIISQTKQQMFTNEKGEFKFENLKPGPYTLRFIHKDYNVLKMPHQEVFANSSIFLPVELVPGTGEGEGNDESFLIGGIEVTAKKNVLTNKLNQVTEISSSEIEHLQATNLGDVMQLIPGVGQMNPGLSSKNQLELRGDNNSTSLFGTKIMLDGSTISNNANITNLNLGAYASTNSNSGVDLREISVDNIESVDVLQGVASAKYGDYTEGVVIVKTKNGIQPNRIKIKDNPDTKDLSINGGFDLSSGDMFLNYNIDFANSERNIRIDGDDYQRVVAQLKLTNLFLEDKSLIVTNGLYFTRLFDDYKDLINPLGVQAYNHGFKFIYNNDLEYKIDRLSKVTFHGTFGYTKQDLFKQYIPLGQAADNRYILGFTTPGTNLVYQNIGTYTYQMSDKGNIWNVNLESEWSKKGVRIGSYVNNFSAGVQYQYDDNTGQGTTFDPLRPPTPDERPLSYDIVPANSTLSLYCEDEINGQFFKPFTLSLGLRYEMFSPEGIQWEGLLGKKDFVKSRSGSYLEPRISFRYFLSPDTRIRLGFGMTAKAPSLQTLFPKPVYFDIRDYFGDKRDSLDSYPRMFTTYIYNTNNLYVKAYYERKFEAYLDQKITEDIGFTLRGYYSYRNNEPVSFYQNIFMPSYYRPNYPNNGGEIFKSYVLLANSDLNKYRNVGYSNSYGSEITIISKKIEEINSSFYVSASFNYYDYNTHGGYDTYGTYSLWKNLDSLQKKYHVGSNDSYIIPVYRTGDQIDSWHKNLILKYKWDYTVRKLGLWFTLWAQQVVGNWYKDYINQDKTSVGYITEENGGKYYEYGKDVPKEARFSTKYEKDSKNSVVDTWSFNINVSKSLYKGAEVSFFVNNFIDRYNNIFYGLELSMDVNRIFE
jgi:hypothetical protein